MPKIRFEKVGDIHSKYAYLEVFFEGEKSLSNDKTLFFKAYTTMELTLQQWGDILKTAKVFHVETIRDEGYFEHFMQEQ